MSTALVSTAVCSVVLTIPGGREGMSRVLGAVPALLGPNGHQPFPGSAALLHRAGMTLGSTVLFKSPGVVFRLCHEPTTN